MFELGRKAEKSRNRRDFLNCGFWCSVRWGKFGDKDRIYKKFRIFV